MLLSRDLNPVPPDLVVSEAGSSVQNSGQYQHERPVVSQPRHLHPPGLPAKTHQDTSQYIRTTRTNVTRFCSGEHFNFCAHSKRRSIFFAFLTFFYVEQYSVLYNVQSPHGNHCKYSNKNPTFTRLGRIASRSPILIILA